MLKVSNVNAKKLIDSGIAIKVESLKLEDNSKQQILISPEILPELPDYFKGAPKELVEEILNRQKVLSKI